MYKFYLTNYFKRQIKKLVKKDHQLKNNLIDLLTKFNKEQSTPLGKNVYKLRLQKSGRGKSSGYRVLIYIFEIENTLYPICIYAKNEKENISPDEMIQHLESTNTELEEKENTTLPNV